MFNETEKLIKGLQERNIPYTVRDLFDGVQIITAHWDVICHRYSYGGNVGLLEAMGSIVRNKDDDVEGWLTAETILCRIDGHREFTCMYNDFSCPYFDIESCSCHMQFDDPECYPPDECDECIDEEEEDEDE